jgi:hypothetical protein
MQIRTPRYLQRVVTRRLDDEDRARARREEPVALDDFRRPAGPSSLPGSRL